MNLMLGRVESSCERRLLARKSSSLLILKAKLSTENMDASTWEKVTFYYSYKIFLTTVIRNLCSGSFNMLSVFMQYLDSEKMC